MNFHTIMMTMNYTEYRSVDNHQLKVWYWIRWQNNTIISGTCFVKKYIVWPFSLWTAYRTGVQYALYPMILLSAWYLITADVNSRCTADILLLLLCINIPYTVAMVPILDVSEILSPNAALRISYRNLQFDIISWTASVKRHGLLRSWGAFWLNTLTPGIFIFCLKFLTWRTWCK